MVVFGLWRWLRLFLVVAGWAMGGYYGCVLCYFNDCLYYFNVLYAKIKTSDIRCIVKCGGQIDQVDI